MMITRYLHAVRKRAGLLSAAALCAGIALGHAALAESLFSENSYRALGADHKASNIGDVITIQVIENSSASSSADTSDGRKSSTDAQFSMTRRPTTALSFNTHGDFDGGGTTQRSGRLLAQMTASVVGITPAGDLLIRGEQQLTVNDEKQKIQVKGRVRPDDVSSSNVVLSTRISDAEIIYLGDGEIAGRQKPAWWTRFLHWIGF